MVVTGLHSSPFLPSPLPASPSLLPSTSFLPPSLSLSSLLLLFPFELFSIQKVQGKQGHRDPTKHDSDPFKASSVAEREREEAVSHQDDGDREAPLTKIRVWFCVHFRGMGEGHEMSQATMIEFATEAAGR